MARRIVFGALMLLLAPACSSGNSSHANDITTGGNAIPSAGASPTSAQDGGRDNTATGGGAVVAVAGGVSVGGVSAGGVSAGGASAGGPNVLTGDIGMWTDAPGACPNGMARVDLANSSDLASASRGEDKYAGDAASICYFIRNGQYIQSSSTLLMYIKKGGIDAAHRRLFVGESRTGVVINGRATIETGANHVQLSNLSFDLTGYSQSGSFNTLTLAAGSTDLRIDHVTFTGDCNTGAKGGHVEVDGSTDVVVEACLIEKFGRCGPDGHLDHGVYLGSGSNITVRNNDIRGNASRGVQLNTEGGNFGTLDTIVIERNRIHDNGHGDYEDGIVMDARDTGTISNVDISHNLVYGNYYSGIREVGDAFRSVVIQSNTFYQNGVKSSGAGRSELNLDDTGSGANTAVTLNIVVAANRVLNNCYDAQPRSYALSDNVVQGNAPSGAAANCISGSVSTDPSLRDPANADFHPQNPAVSGYGAYAP